MKQTRTNHLPKNFNAFSGILTFFSHFSNALCSSCFIDGRINTSIAFPYLFRLFLASTNTFRALFVIPKMSEALLGDDSSQTSQRSALSGSLLERIRAQREAQQQQRSSSSAAAPAPVELPSYTPVEPTSNNERWSLNVSWPHVLTPGTHSHEDTASEALLSPATENDGYSMGGYLKTFVQDFYNLFRSMHPVVQGIVVVVLLYIAIKLI